MTFYERSILPHLIHLAMRQDRLDPYRQRLVADARGRVLEIGMGSGLNVPRYPPRVSVLIGLDPSAQLLERARMATAAALCRVDLINGSAESIPLDDRTVDRVVTAWTLCSILDVARALHEVRRVLRADGTFLFVEHGRSPDMGVARWQDRLTPVWKRIAGGCHLNRPIQQLIEEAGFRIERMDTGYMSGPRPMTFMYEGRARPR